MSRVLFIDFEDSFTYNVVQELTKLGPVVEVINWKEFHATTDHDLLVLGPGPGHPDDYQTLFPLIEQWLSLGKKIFAVCLGHQILWRMRGADVSRSEVPLHGQKVEFNIPLEWQNWADLAPKLLVQRYNSLAVKDDQHRDWAQVASLIVGGEVMMSRSPQIISYQFHPESMGTKCRHAFFRPILRDLL